MAHEETIQVKRNKVVEVFEEVTIQVGECPQCHKRQEAISAFLKIDVLCKECKFLEWDSKKAKMNEKLHGATIEEIVWDEQSHISDIDSIRIKAKDGSIHSIEVCYDSESEFLSIIDCPAKELT